MTNLHIGVVGCGEWGQYIVRDLVALGSTVTVVASSAASRARAASSGANSILSSPDELAGVDGVVVATPTSAHAGTISAVASLNVPMFCEKPLTDDPIEASTLADELGDRLFVMDKWRYHPGVEALRDIADSGSIGTIRALRLRRMGWSNPHGDVDAAWILLPHDLSIALEILGGALQVNNATGVVADGQIRTAWVQGRVGDVQVACEMSIESRVRDRSVILFGSEGTASLSDPLDDHVNVQPLSVPFTAPSKQHHHPISTEYPLVRELRTFVEHLQGGPGPKSSAAEGAQTVATVAQIRSMIGVGKSHG